MNKPSVEIALPVLNEAVGLEKNVVSLLEYIDRELMPDYSIKVSIADNGSTDATPQIAEQLCHGRATYIGGIDLGEGDTIASTTGARIRIKTGL